MMHDLDGAEYMLVTECEHILCPLTASTAYQVDVCTVTKKGNGPRATIDLVTASAGMSINTIDNHIDDEQRLH
jgi:hypothetical protein